MYLYGHQYSNVWQLSKHICFEFREVVMLYIFFLPFHLKFYFLIFSLLHLYIRNKVLSFLWLYPVLKGCSKIPDFPGCLRISSQHLAFRLQIKLTILGINTAQKCKHHNTEHQNSKLKYIQNKSFGISFAFVCNSKHTCKIG